MSESTDIVRRVIEGYSAGDADAVAKFADPEEFVSVIEDSSPNGGTYHGFEGFLEAVTAWEEAWSSSELRPTRFEERGDWVLARVEQSLTGALSGIEIDQVAWYAFRLRDDRGVELHVYLDEGRAREVAGIPRPG